MASQKSTTVRLAPSQRLAQGALGALDRMAPPIAARVGARLWFRLPASPTAERRRRREPAGGETFALAGDGLVVRGRVYGEEGDRPTAYLVHGWGGYWQQLGSFVEPLTEAGYRVVVHDAPSHGDSPAGRYGPRSTRVMEMARAHALVVERYGTPTLTVAHSLGVMAVLWAVRHHGTPPGALVTVAAATDVEELVDSFRRMAGFGGRSRTAMLDRIERIIGIPRAEFEGPALAAAVLADRGAMPLLAVHDTTDGESPVRISERLVDAWPGAELVRTEGLGHRRVLWAPEVVERVAAFAAQQLPSVSGGRTGILAGVTPERLRADE